MFAATSAPGKPRRSEFARHFGPAALRREALRRYGVEATPRRVAPGEPLWRALDWDSGALVAAWAAVVEPPEGPHDATPPVEAVCAVWRNAGGAHPGASHVVAWGAACVAARDPGGWEDDLPAAGWHRRPAAAPLVVGRATGPAVWPCGAPSRRAPSREALWLSERPRPIYTTNDNPTCGGFDCAEAALRRGRPEARRTHNRLRCAFAERLTVFARAGVNGIACEADYVLAVRAPRFGARRVDALGLRARPPAWLSAGRAYYRDAPAQAAAAALLGRRGPAAHRYHVLAGV